MSLSSNIKDGLKDAICRPIGTYACEYTSSAALGKNCQAGILISIAARGHYFRVDRTAERVLRFFHSSPGTGTRLAAISLASLPDFEQAYLSFSWTPEEVTLYCSPRGIKSEMLMATGAKSPISFRIAQDGTVHQIGDEANQVANIRIYRDGQSLLAPTALETWASTLQAIEILWTGKSEMGLSFEVVQANATLSILVTGLESYGKTRLLELETEGIPGNWSELFLAFASKAMRESNRLEEIRAEATANSESIFVAVVKFANINFQNYGDIKRAYRSAYGIKLGEVGVDSQTLSELQTLIGYRHRIVHISPLLTMLNQDRVPPEEPVFANHQLADLSVACFNNVVEALHKATLMLRPPSSM